MIYNAQRHHGGDYTCIAENEAGQDSKVATITVFGKLSANSILSSINDKNLQMKTWSLKSLERSVYLQSVAAVGTLKG